MIKHELIQAAARTAGGIAPGQLSRAASPLGESS
jgi:hypothetical protein